DSRAYLYRQGKLSRLTKDHSVVQKMIDHNMLSEEEARNHPDASVINRAFGQSPELELEISEPIEMQPGDGLLLCTDGLSGYVSDEEIAQRIGGQGDAQEITNALIDLALEAGGEDNVTVQYVLFAQNGKPAIGVPAESSVPERQSFAGSADQEAVTKLSDFSRRTSVALIVGGFLFGLLLGWFVAGGTTEYLRAWWQKRTTAAASPSPTPKNSGEKPSAEPSREIPKGNQEPQNNKSGAEAPAAPGKPIPKPSPVSAATNDVPK
ncbi:MAG TPA: hypothetical protein VN920_14950, partial [Pyrinomonadaceae bacterium]|nr:hypothetical protein [Pyrinomonadaceae bacterium]